MSYLKKKNEQDLINAYLRRVGDHELANNNCLKVWTERDDRHLMHHHNYGYNSYQIAKMMKRTPESIKQRIKELKKKQRAR